MRLLPSSAALWLKPSINAQSVVLSSSVPTVPLSATDFVAPTDQMEAPRSLSEAYLISSHELSFRTEEKIVVETEILQLAA